jgi:hypothetical protein
MAMNLLTKMWSSKRRYGTRPDAARALREGHMWRPPPGEKVTCYYFCLHCAGSHLATHRRQWVEGRDDQS